MLLQIWPAFLLKECFFGVFFSKIMLESWSVAYTRVFMVLSIESDCIKKAQKLTKHDISFLSELPTKCVRLHIQTQFLKIFWGFLPSRSLCSTDAQFASTGYLKCLANYFKICGEHCLFIKNAGKGFVFAVEMNHILNSFYNFDTYMLSLVLYSETGKFLQENWNLKK